MDLSKYQDITGITVSSAKSGYIQAQIRRVQSMLETMLGYTLTPDNRLTNLYNELGKARTECSCPSVDIEDEDLDEPDDVEYAYRLFSYSNLDKYLHVDPFLTLNKVKLVYVKPGTGDTGITLRTFDPSRVRVDVGRDGLAKYIELCKDCFCSCECTDCIQLAVDADWVWTEENEVPTDLQYVWADMVTYYADQKRNIKSESITTHSYTKFDNVAPETEPSNLAVIQKYAGPYGSVVSNPTVAAEGRRDLPWVY